MKNAAMKTTVLLIVVACIGAFSFTMHNPTAPGTQPDPNDLEESHEVYLGTTSDGCGKGYLKVEINGSGTYSDLIPTNGTWVSVKVKVDADRYWKWKCGTSLEQSRVTECPQGTNPNLVKVRYLNGTITWKCYTN